MLCHCDNTFCIYIYIYIKYWVGTCANMEHIVSYAKTDWGLLKDLLRGLYYRGAHFIEGILPMALLSKGVTLLTGLLLTKLPNNDLCRQTCTIVIVRQCGKLSNCWQAGVTTEIPYC
jgi:hypothetical protein